MYKLMCTKVVALAVAALLLTAWPAHARPGGSKGGGGGNRGGSFGRSYGGYGGYGRYGYGGYGRYGYGGYGRYGYGRGFYGYPGYGWGFGLGVGYPGYYWGAYDYPYYPYAYGYDPYLYGYPPPPPVPPPGYTAAYPPSAVTAAPVLLNVAVPADAEVWVDGQKTTQTGALRRFSSPPVAPGKDFQYQIRARWNNGGQPVERTRTVHVHAGQQLTVNLVAARGT